MKLCALTLSLSIFCIFILSACGGHEHLSQEEQAALEAAKNAHQKAYEILGKTEKQLKALKNKIPSDSVKAIEVALATWEKEAVGLPEEEGEHSHEHHHGEDGHHHHHAPAPKVTMQEMQAIQEEMLKSVQSIKQRVENLSK